MAVTVDNKLLNVLSFSQSVKPKGSEWDAFEDGQYKRKVFIYSVLRGWTLECVEHNVAWADSVCKYLIDKMAGGETVNLIITGIPALPSLNVNAYVKDVGFSASDVADKNVRTFTVELQEA